MPDEMLDYNVDTTVQFKLPEMSSEFNSLAVNDLRKVFVEHVKNVFEKDETLGDPGYVSGPLNFKFCGLLCPLRQRRTGGLRVRGQKNRMFGGGSGYVLA